MLWAERYAEISLEDVFLGKSGLAAATASVIAKVKSVLTIMIDK